MSKLAKTLCFIAGSVVVGLYSLMFVQAYDVPQMSERSNDENLVSSDTSWPDSPGQEDDPVWPDTPALAASDPVWPDTPALAASDPVWPDSPEQENDPVWPDSPAANT